MQATKSNGSKARPDVINSSDFVNRLGQQIFLVLDLLLQTVDLKSQVICIFAESLSSLGGMRGGHARHGLGATRYRNACMKLGQLKSL